MNAAGWMTPNWRYGVVCLSGSQGVNHGVVLKLFGETFL